MATKQHPYLFLTVFLVAAPLFALVPLGLAWVWAKTFSPQKSGEQKNAVYECGLESKQDARVQFKSEYYLYGIMFLIFDVEAIFLLPFATVFRHVSVEAFLAVMVFLVL